MSVELCHGMNPQNGHICDVWVVKENILHLQHIFSSLRPTQDTDGEERTLVVQTTSECEKSIRTGS